MSPIGFLEGVKELGVTDLEEVEVACLMRVLTKADLENAILLRELIVIMENFGIQDDDGEGAEEGAGERSAEVNDEEPNVGDSAGKADTSMAEDSSAKKPAKKKKKGAAANAAPMDLS